MKDTIFPQDRNRATHEEVEMKLQYSEEVPDGALACGDLAGGIPLRRSRAAAEEAVGATNARQDWTVLLGPIPGFRGGWAPRFGLMQVAVPECLPERLELISYACEFGFLYDDFIEPYQMSGCTAQDLEHDKQDSHLDVRQRMSTFAMTLQKRLFMRMLEIDKPRALVAIQSWQIFQSSLSGKHRASATRSVASYLEYRIVDVGELLWFGLVTFGMGLDIPEDERTEVRQLSRPCWTALALQNDLCSYEKEKLEYAADPGGQFLNAIAVLTHEGLSEEQAKCEVLLMLKEQVNQYQDVVSSALHSTLAVDSKTYLEALLYTLSGDAAWSLTCPRYNMMQHKNANDRS